MRVAMIWAMAANRVIGKDGGLPWHLPAEMKWFRQCTLGKPIIAGRKTFESFGKPLPKRTNIVVTRQSGYLAEGAVVVPTVEAALKCAAEICERDGAEESVVVGGAEIYALAFPMTDRLYLTEVHAEIEGDVRFPEFDLDAFERIEANRSEPDENNPFAFTTQVLERKQTQAASTST